MGWLSLLLLATPLVQAADTEVDVSVTLQNGDNLHPKNNSLSRGSNYLRKARAPDARSLRQSASTRIIGGNEAVPGQFPYFVEWNSGCGGSYIDTNWVLTAAHCYHAQRRNVWLGGAVNSRTGVKRRIAQFYVHPWYDRYAGNEPYDVALLRLDPDETSNRTYTTLKLNEDTGRPVNGQILTTMGFGYTAESGLGASSSDVLNYVDVPLITNCRRFYSKVDPKLSLCAGYQWGGMDACAGDSGGPINMKNANNEDVQVGITSWGEGCARANKPGVYSRVSTFTPWIKQKLCQYWRQPDANHTYSTTLVGGVEDCVRIKIHWSLQSDATSTMPHTIDLHILETTHNRLVYINPTVSVVTSTRNFWRKVELPGHGDYVVIVRDTTNLASNQTFGLANVTLTNMVDNDSILMERSLVRFSSMTRMAFSTNPAVPSSAPSPTPTRTPEPSTSFEPSYTPTLSQQPSMTRYPTFKPSNGPTMRPTLSPEPTSVPSKPSTQPSNAPSGLPSSSPSRIPTLSPTGGPTGKPTNYESWDADKWHQLRDWINGP